MKHSIYWTPQKIESRLKLIQPLEYQQRHVIPPFRFKTLSSPDVEPPVAPDVNDDDWQILEPFTYWGTWFTDFIMRTTFEVPADWDKNAPVVLHLPLGKSGDFSHPEALAYIDGKSYASADRHHHEIMLPNSVKDGQTHALALHGWTGLGGWQRNPNSKTKLYMEECAVVQVHQPTRDFIARARMALEISRLLDDNETAKGRILNVLDEAFKVLDTRDPIRTEAFYESVPAALETLVKGLEEAGEPMDVDIIGVGHAHIDVAWLWQLGHTRRKAGRTFSNVLRLMEQYPEYHFTQSQPQLYKYTEQVYPEIFEGIKQRVAEGRWELIGGTWVEPDCNATGPESLARQFLLGRTYFRKHFGDVDTPVLWLPDTFGYSWALPQLIKQAGMEYFITHKMSWNQYNQMPFQLLWWQGIDGTKVLTHFLTTPSGSELLPYSTTYNAVVDAKEIMGTWENFHQKETYNELITAYGYGDGGGGPTREMIENIESLSSMPGAPRVRAGTVKEFLDGVEREVADELPTWNGEFYLELHRGTLTSQARNKWNNRKSEFLLHDAEFVAALASQVAGFEYPADAFAEAWELICLNQFHDILPGSSITPVYEDSTRDYARIRQLGEQTRDAALAALSNTLSADAVAMAINPTTFTGDRVGLLPETINGGLLDTRDGSALLTQAVEGGTLVDLPELPAFSVMPLTSGAAPEQSSALSVTEDGDSLVVENALMRVTFAENGDIVSLFDKEASREVLAEGEVGNQLLAMEDRPLDWDAWDVDIFYDDRVEKLDAADRVEVIETGPVRAALLVERTYRSSTITQRIYIYHNSKRIDFDTHVDWHQSHTLLKAAFPVDVLSPTATFDIQWGNVERNTHRNTSWDWGRFETAAQKWADLSEGNYGVALLNDSKYGYDVLHNVMRLSLLKSATMPDPIADQGEHKMIYSLLPHTGDWRNGVPENAYDLNDPVILRSVAGAGQSLGQQLVGVDSRNAVIETVKLAEDGEGIIVRLYEGERNRGPVTLNVGFPVKAIYHCNLLEENQEQLDVTNDQVTLSLRPYEIVTLRIVAE
ncbi:alpha-mannosidase [Phototrophicus methaneseepsis]|uniref:Alpha-mannosidase n=1 Tax=Phototrophicus methaneseepsis TaxID=2710758 RepID=A0A7S8ID82_9CHLR|nr:alpha-mannosidase [Phototrophicus methaneseepsis]QPC81271.1 alpha-mannosidase [Phototrophicus methaneseepsis]